MPKAPGCLFALNFSILHALLSGSTDDGMFLVSLMCRLPVQKSGLWLRSGNNHFVEGSLGEFFL